MVPMASITCPHTVDEHHLSAAHDHHLSRPLGAQRAHAMCTRGCTPSSPVAGRPMHSLWSPWSLSCPCTTHVMYPMHILHILCVLRIAPWTGRMGPRSQSSWQQSPQPPRPEWQRWSCRSRPDAATSLGYRPMQA